MVQNDQNGDDDSWHSFYHRPNDLLRVLLKNPFISQPEDELGEKALAAWVLREYKFKTGKDVTKLEIKLLIGRLSKDGIFLRKQYGERVLIKPTRNYFLLKAGKPLIHRENEAPAPLKCAGQLPLSKKSLSFSRQSGDKENCDAYIGDLSCYDVLIQRIRQYQGRDKDLIEIFPAFLDLACKILNDRFTDWHSKILISSALGYFILEHDVMPDNEEFGYSDDLYILTYALREIKKHVSPRLLEENWAYEGDILELIEDTFKNLSIVVESDTCDILHKIGLLKFKELNLEEYSGSYQHRVAKLAREKRELLGITAYLLKQLYNVSSVPRDIQKVKEQLQTYGDYDEIQRLIALSNAGHHIEVSRTIQDDTCDDDFEERSRQERLRALLDD